MIHVANSGLGSSSLSCPFALPFRHFHLDGQLSPLVDFLEGRPSLTDHARQAVLQGEWSLGPWYTQPDEFLPSVRALLYLHTPTLHIDIFQWPAQGMLAEQFLFFMASIFS